MLTFQSLHESLHFVQSLRVRRCHFRETNLGRAPQLIKETQRLRSQQACFGQDCDKVSLASHDEGSHANPLVSFKGFCKQAVSLVRVCSGCQKVSFSEKHWTDLRFRYEAAQIDIT